MEDEDGYTVMSLQRKRVNMVQPFPPGSQELLIAQNHVVVVQNSAPEISKEDFSEHGSPPSLRGYKIAVGILGAVCVLLTAAVIAQSLWGFQAGQDCPKAECNLQQEAFISRLKQNLCDSIRNGTGGGSRCKLCPENWRAHQGKCYWDSKGSKFWNDSKKDCELRHSQMLVIQDQEDMDFIQNITDGINHVWIGLNITSHTRNWTWVDGSPFNHTLFPVSGHIASDSCGVVKGNQINSETCSAEFKWICQKDAVVV